MDLTHQTLPYEIRKTACELFAGKTGFTQAEMKVFFNEEIRKAVPPPPFAAGDDGFWASFAQAMDRFSYDQKLLLATQSSRAEAFEYWLSLLPLQTQKELLLELCRKPHFPMSKGQPSQEQRDRLAALLTNFVIDSHVAFALQRFNSTYVMKTWQKAIARCVDGDPGGAITAARTLLESICKHILDACSSPYDEKDDFQKLYSLAAQELKIASRQQNERSLRQVFSGCHSVIDGLGTLRNHLSDAHGKGSASTEPPPYLATLAVNLAGSLALLLMQVWETDPRSYSR